MHSLCILEFVCVCDFIQVEALADDTVVDGPIYVTINVLDVNNNAPYFNQSVYTAVVREHSPAGVWYEYLKKRGGVILNEKKKTNSGIDLMYTVACTFITGNNNGSTWLKWFLSSST